jgi:ribonuclease III
MGSVEVAVPDSLVALLQLDLGTAQVREFSKTLTKVEALLGYQFKDPSLCEHALTHGSRQSKRADYQRLEFLGDRVLSLVIAEDLFSRFSLEQEGQLAARLSQLVRGETCAAVGQALHLDEYIIVGQIEKSKGVQRIASVVGDVVEALIGAIYLDGGLEAARTFILRCWNEMLIKSPADLKDSKTYVQEWALARAMPLPHYEVIGREGPEHAPVFTISLKVGPHDLAVGAGASKQSAEMAAAAAFITREGLR